MPSQDQKPGPKTQAGSRTLWSRRFWRSWRIRGAFVLWVLSLALYHVLPGSPRFALAASYVLCILLLGLTVAALEHRVHRLRQPRERKFWHEISFAFVCSLGAALVGSLFLPTEPSIAVTLLINALSSATIVLLIFALEAAPHREDRRSVASTQEKLNRLAISCFLAFFVIYFDLIPRRGTSAAELLSGQVLHGLLYLYFGLRCLINRLRQPSLRWRQLYGLMALAVLPAAAVHWVRAAQLLSFDSGAPSTSAEALATADLARHGLLAPGLLLSYILWIVVARARFLDLPSPKPRSLQPIPIVYGATSSFYILLSALALPCLHLALHNFQLMSSDHTQAREILVTLALLTLGAIALRQHRTVRKSSNELLQRRARAESALRKSEASVRLTIQRQASAQEIQAAEARFAKFFRNTPNALLISTLKEGRILEVNGYFETLSGYPPQGTVGQTVAKLNLWKDPDMQRALVTALESGRLRNRQLDLVRQDGSVRTVLLSAEHLDLNGQACVLAVLRDISAQAKARRLLDERSLWRRHIESEQQRRRWPRRRQVTVDDETTPGLDIPELESP